jgi:hypothetical protein
MATIITNFIKLIKLKGHCGKFNDVIVLPSCLRKAKFNDVIVLPSCLRKAKFNMIFFHGDIQVIRQ